MSKRKVLVLLSVGLLVGVILWLFCSPRETDGQKYHRMQRLRRLEVQAYSAEQSRLGALLRPFALSDQLTHRFDVRRDQLLASGYLTNISVELSNAAGRKAYVFQRLTGVERSSDALVCDLVFASNSLVITCRPRDAGSFLQALTR
jgi:hypothetical protein